MEQKRRRMRRRPRRSHTPSRGASFDAQRQMARKKRRRKQLIKAFAAWAACLLLVAVIAFSVARLIGYMGDSRQRSLKAQGIEQMEEGDLQAAITSFDQALEAASSDKSALSLDVLQYRAEAEYRLADYEAAAYTYGLLMERDPKTLENWYMAAMCSAALGKADQALAYYNHVMEAGDEAVKETAGRPQAMAAVGEACVQAGLYDEAIGMYQKAIGDGLDDGETYNQMGLCQMAGQAYKDAADSFDKGKVKAEEAGDEALLKELSYNRAVASEYMQDYEKAGELFEAYIKRFGEDENARHEIEFLKSR